jgi:2-C-methyl-D-erythritol 4-phosphate cytidylyltransferase
LSAPVVYAVVAAAGQGTRMGREGRKQFVQLLGRPVLAYSLRTLDACESIRRIYLAVNPDDVDWVKGEWLPRYAPAKPVEVLAGGAERQDTVSNALKRLPRDCDAVIVHDGARPLASVRLFERCIAALAGWDGVIPVIPCRDTVKEVAGETVTGTPERVNLRQVQTPQVFRPAALLDAYNRAGQEGFSATDDAGVLERYGYNVRVVEGETANIKITYREDLVMAEALLRMRGSTN